MKKLYKFYWDCGQQGDLDGLFIADEADVKRFIGHRACFGEVLGKHSDINGTLEEEDLEVVSEDQNRIEWLEDLLGSTLSGYNPLHYISIFCDNCGFELYEYGEWAGRHWEMIGENFYCKSCIESVDKE